MITRDRKVRLSVKAIVIRDGRLLLMRAKDRWGTYYLLPGGGQKNGETLHDALRRECLEETGVAAGPLRPRYIRDYVGKNHEFARWDKDFHQVEIMFLCRYEGKKRTARRPDVRQTGAVWMPLERLAKIRLYPSILKKLIGPAGRLSGPVYLGDVN
ncbi:MAG TPA: NUDIX hydrolase [Elusimicrobia bacterium]|nr:NUDIX hydrolase [Elusimicrobiota bacterium]